MKNRQVAIKYTKHFWDRAAMRYVDLAALIDLYSKALKTKVGNPVVGENQFSKIIGQRTKSDEVLLITGYRKFKHKNYEEHGTFKKTDIVVKHTKLFWKKITSKDIDLTAILDVYSKAAQAKIGDFVIGENQSSKIVARRISAAKIILITGYKITSTPTEEENSTSIDNSKDQ